MKHAMTLLATLGLLIGCSSSSKPATQTSTTNTTSTTSTTNTTTDKPKVRDIGEGIAWADKSKKQKGAFMKVEVIPAVAAIWKDSPEPDEKVDCTTCHGDAAMDGDFEMPNKKLPALNPADQFAAHKDKASWLKFMGSKLVPTMAKTLGVEPYNMKTHKGFGCFACHTMAKPKK